VIRLTVVVASVLVCISGGARVVYGQDAFRSVHEAANAGNVAAIKQFIEKGADLNAPDSYGYTPLKRAIQSYNADAVKALLEGGANPNTKDADSSTPLMLACMSSQKDMVAALLAAKADLKLTNHAGWTVLHCAVQVGQAEIAEMLINAGADVNAKDRSGQTPLSIAKQRGTLPEIEELLKAHGGTVPPPIDPMAMYGDYGMTTQVAGSQSQRPEDFVIDANEIREQLAKLTVLQAPLKAVDANSESEQRAWIARRSDNRTLLIRAVQKQFEEEMVFVKRVAVEEKAAKTTKAVDDLVAGRKLRYEQIGQELREQRRQALQESRDSMATARGRGTATSRGTRGRSSGVAGGYTGTSAPTRSGASTQDAYGATGTQARAPRRPGADEPNEPAVSAETQTQIQAWLNASPENKNDLLKATQELDVVEYAALHEKATEEEAAKTQVAIMALLMLREERVAKIEQKWREDDERMQRFQDRTGNMQGTQPGTQQGTRRGRR